MRTFVFARWAAILLPISCPTTTSANQAPVATPAAVATPEDSLLQITLAGSDAESPFGMLGDYARQQFIDPLSPVPDNLSGASWNAASGTLFLIRNYSQGSGNAYEFSHGGVHVRTITESHFTDTEAIAWMFGDTFAIAEENNEQRISICTITPSATTVDRTAPGNVSFATPWSGGALGNSGLESLCYDPDADRLLYLMEKPTGNSHWYIYTMNPADGSTEVLCDLYATVETANVATDVSDMTLDRATRTLLLLSDESNKIIRINRSGTVLETLPIQDFNQPEGIALSPDRQKLFVVGEARQFARYELPAANLTYQIVSGPSHGTLSGVPPGVNYTPAPNYHGTDSFTFKVNDGTTDSAPATVSLTITPVDDPCDLAVEQPTGTDLASGNSTVAFGPATPQSPVDRVFTVRNTSPDNALTGIAASFSGAHSGDFSLVTAPPAALPSGSSAQFTVRFTPQAVGARSAVLSVASNDADENPFLIALSGTGHSAPTFQGYALAVKSGQSASVYLAKILAKAADADGDALSVSAVGSSQIGGAISLGPSTLNYTAPQNAAVDTIPLTVVDARGGTVTNNLTVTVVADTALSGNVGHIQLNIAQNTADLLFYGIPGRSYQIQRSSDLQTWTTRFTLGADSLGRIAWTDPGPLPSPCFYRTRPVP